MKNSIRWLLTESRISSLDPNRVNFVDGKLICYHLTSHQKWASYNSEIEDKLKHPIIKHPKQERSADNSRAMRIVKNLKDSDRISHRDAYDVEEEVIMDMIDDPYTDTSGFTPGSGAHHGVGLYTCYKFNPNIARNYGDICLVFEIDISNFIITFEDLAKQVHGENWRIKDQLVKLYKRKPRDEESLEVFSKMVNRIEESKINLNQTINEMSPHTSQVSYALMDTFSKDFITSIYDGIVFLGQGDGPVCVSFFPKYDAKLIGLGRLSSRTAKAEVDWYDSLNDFVGGRARNKLDFQTMNDIAEENTSLNEKEEMKENERVFYDAKFNYVLSTLRKILYEDETITKLVEFYEEIKSSGNKEKLEAFYKEIGTGKYTQNFVEFNTLSQASKRKYANILEETYQFHKKSGSIDKIADFLENTGIVLGHFVDINFSDDLLINGVYNASKKYFTGLKQRDYINTRSASDFLASAKKHIKNRNCSKEFIRLVQDLEDTYGIDIKLNKSNWIELIELYENSNQEIRDRIISLPGSSIDKHPLKDMSLPDNFGNFVPVYYYKSKEIIDKFCNIVDEMIKRRNINVLDSLHLAFKHVEHPLSNIIVEKCIDELVGLPDGDDKKRITANLVSYFNKFTPENPAILEKFHATRELMIASESKVFDKLINNLEKKTKPQGGLLDYNKIFYDASKKLYFESQEKPWHERLINLIIENVKSNPKFAKLKQVTVLIINYSLNIRDIEISEQDQRLLLKAAGSNAYWLLDYKYISQSVYSSFLISVLQSRNSIQNILNSCQVSVCFFKHLYSNKQLLDAFIQYSDNGFFKRTLNRLIAPLRGQPCPLNVDTYNLYRNESTSVDMKQVIDPNDNEWFSYLLEEIRVKTDSGKTKRAASLFKEFDTLMMQRVPSQGVQEPELDLSHRKIVGNSLKEVYNF
jgi:hypothetical protein